MEIKINNDNLFTYDSNLSYVKQASLAKTVERLSTINKIKELKNYNPIIEKKSKPFLNKTEKVDSSDIIPNKKLSKPEINFNKVRLSISEIKSRLDKVQENINILQTTRKQLAESMEVLEEMRNKTTEIISKISKNIDTQEQLLKIKEGLNQNINKLQDITKAIQETTAKLLTESNTVIHKDIPPKEFNISQSNNIMDNPVISQIIDNFISELETVIDNIKSNTEFQLNFSINEKNNISLEISSEDKILVNIEDINSLNGSKLEIPIDKKFMEPSIKNDENSKTSKIEIKVNLDPIKINELEEKTNDTKEGTVSIVISDSKEKNDNKVINIPIGKTNEQYIKINPEEVIPQEDIQKLEGEIQNQETTPEENIQNTLNSIESVIDKVSSSAGKLDAINQRLNTDISRINVFDINNNIEDVSKAFTTSKVVKNQILEQPQTSVMSQANIDPGRLIELLKGEENKKYDNNN